MYEKHPCLSPRRHAAEGPSMDQRVDRALVATILALDPVFHSHSFPLWAEICG